MYGAYIGSDGGSGITVEGSTPEELGENMSGYIADFAHKLTEDEEDDECTLTDEQKEEIDNAVDRIIETFKEEGRLAEHASLRELMNNLQEILEAVTIGDDDRELTDEEWVYAISTLGDYAG